MLLTLTLAGLLAAPELQAEPQNGWVVLTGEDGYLYHPKQAEPPKRKGWTIEVGSHPYHLKQPRKGFLIEFQWPKAKPQREPVWFLSPGEDGFLTQWPKAKPQREPVEAQYHDDLSAFFKQAKGQVQVKAVEAFYVDDLPASFKQLKKR
jgi:hypothetical protein